MTQNRIIGLTGNSGCGKTTVAEIIAAQGGFAINADVIAHRVMEPGKPAYIKIIAAFGQEILSQETPGTPPAIDRKALGAIVFNDIEKRTMLERIVHPQVIEEVVCKIDEIKNAGDAPQIITVDAVLLVESNLHKHCNEVWLITAPEEARLARIIARDGLTPQAAAARMRNQRDTRPIAGIAQVIIHNDGDLAALTDKVNEVI